MILHFAATTLASLLAQTEPSAPRPLVSRADLARAYLRVEQALARSSAGEDTIAEANRLFDAATMTFFGGGSGVAIRQLQETEQLLLASRSSPSRMAALSLMARPQPPVIPLDTLAAHGASLDVRLVAMYELEAEPEQQHTLRLLLTPQGHLEAPPLAASSVQLTTGAGWWPDLTLSMPLDGVIISPGLYSLAIDALVEDDLPPVEIGRVQFAQRSLDGVRKDNIARLNAVNEMVMKPGDVSPLSTAIANATARNNLLSDQPSDMRSAQFMVDLDLLAQQVDAEITSLEKGIDPYIGRRGDAWRVLPGGRTGPLPFRLYVPDDVHADAPADLPMPLLIALHGAGGDENMFMDAYGIGLVKRLAREHRFIVATPLNYQFGGNARAFDALLNLIAREHSVDRERIYILGHSMGAAGAWSLARARPDVLAAAVCMAGGGGQPAATPDLPDAPPRMAPTLVIGAELDPIIPELRLRDLSARAAAQGLPVTYRTSLGAGHTLMVNRELADAVDWLFTYRAITLDHTP